MDLRHHDFVGSVEVKLEELMDESRTLLTTTRTLRVPGQFISLLVMFNLTNSTIISIFLFSHGSVYLDK